MHAGSELLFPPYAIAALMDLRGPEWHALVRRVVALPENHRDSLAFSLMMIHLDGCLSCETDSYKAMRGCVQCAIQTIRRYKGSDEDLLRLYEDAQEEVTIYLEEVERQPQKAA